MLARSRGTTFNIGFLGVGEAKYVAHSSIVQRVFSNCNVYVTLTTWNLISNSFSKHDHLQQATKSPYIGDKEASKCTFMYDAILMMIFSFSIKQIMNKIICHKKNLKQTTRDHHCKWVKWILQTQQTTSHKIEANIQIQHHTFFKKSTIITWSSHEKLETKHWNSTTTKLSHMRVKETFSNSTTPIITRQWSKLLKFNMTTSSQECQTNHFKIQWPYHHKKVK
jgi:hypothetical protein